MKAALKFVLIFGAILLTSAILAPVLFNFLPFKFEKIFNRLVMIQSLAAIILFVRFDASILERIGLSWTRDAVPAYLKAFAASFVILSIFVAVRCLAGTAIFAPRLLSGWEWSGAILKALAAGVLVGLIEEFFFRGYIQDTLSRRFRFPIILTLLVTNLFYSLIHFVSYHKPLVGPEPGVFDSFRLMAAPFQVFGHLDAIWHEAAGLFIFGFILSGLVLKTGQLYASMGVHAGCVFFIKLDGSWADFLDARPRIFWGTSNIYDGALGWIFLILLGGFLLRILHQQSSKAGFHK